MYKAQPILWAFCRALPWMLLFVITLLSQSPAFGHNLGQSYTYLKIYDHKITGRSLGV